MDPRRKHHRPKVNKAVGKVILTSAEYRALVEESAKLHVLQAYVSAETYMSAEQLRKILGVPEPPKRNNQGK